MIPVLLTEPLNPAHDRASFSSSSDALDRYLRERAAQDVRRRVAGCFVAVEPDNRIVGFYTLAAAGVALNDLPQGMAKRLPRYHVVPATLIGRLAVATGHQRRGLGGALIADAVLRTSCLGIGAFAVLVDAKDDRARSFYEAKGFVPFSAEPRRLCISIETALRALHG